MLPAPGPWLEEPSRADRGNCCGCQRIADRTSEILVYRQTERFGTPREVNRESLFAAEEATFPHTWDTVDMVNDVVVCVPHTPDPVLFGIRGESPSWVMMARFND